MTAAAFWVVSDLRLSPFDSLQWYPLQGGQGQVHLRLEWLSLLPDAEKLDQVLQWNRGITSRPEPPSAAILVVYLDRAQDLPLKKGNKEPNPMVQLSVQDVTRESKVGVSTALVQDKGEQALP